MPSPRKVIEDAIEALIGVLDMVEPDPDLEDSDPAEDSDPDHGIEDLPHDPEDGA